MSTVVAIGDHNDLGGFALAGVRVTRASSRVEILDAWTSRDPDTEFVIRCSNACNREQRQ